MPDSSLEDLLGSSGETQPSSRRDKRRNTKQNKVKRFVPAILVVLVLAALGGGGFFGYSWISNNVNVSHTSKDFDGEGKGEVEIVVNNGDTGSDIAETLVKAGVIKTKGPFVNAFSASQDAANITPGTYKLRKQMSGASALRLLLDPASRVGIRVTFPEGQTAQKMYERLSEATGLPVEDFEKAGADYEARGVPENPAQSIEGYLWPGTYDFREEDSAEDILDQMVSRMTAQLEKKGIPQEKWHETLTIASIVEKEARDPEDYGKVVRTLENRLAGVGEAGGKPMNLQLDSTVAYFTKSETISTTPEQRATDSPYNTYKHPGLPIGPISNPGDATIDAVKNPPEGPWLYWVTVNTETGETKFASTKAEHDKNVQEWREWAKKK
ncbi:endolytic transglycosylase MltG [Dermabacter sp. p3-SID358]|uniref:endolytic transglycosylase MltG n=1 Tax=Dermabacter sp. p3-SID358 TaxID=2916114 RepID=UPI0021A77A77|nr:endolytic transglycosylase MltG [Dermabacter sp. p3-SID358]MCT1866036.1 endolytic transglycosylase MltG [Dermabacter sp. p3-SID358]